MSSGRGHPAFPRTLPGPLRRAPGRVHPHLHCAALLRPFISWSLPSAGPSLARKTAAIKPLKVNVSAMLTAVGGRRRPLPTWPNGQTCASTLLVGRAAPLGRAACGGSHQAAHRVDSRCLVGDPATAGLCTRCQFMSRLASRMPEVFGTSPDTSGPMPQKACAAPSGFSSSVPSTCPRSARATQASWQQFRSAAN
jgi:hypothetical protein